MARYLSYILFSFVVFSCISAPAASSSLPLDLPLDKRAGKTVILFGDIPARASVEDYVLEKNINADLIRSLYYKTLSTAESNKTFSDRYKNLLVGEMGPLMISISKQTKAITGIDLFLEDDN